MARPRHENPTPAELQVLEVIWERGPSPVRDVMNALHKRRPRAYTTVMSLMDIMHGKGYLKRRQQGQAYLYQAKVTEKATRSKMLKDVLNRVFEGSANLLVVHLLEQAKPSEEELEEIHKTVSEFLEQKGDG